MQTWLNTDARANSVVAEQIDLKWLAHSEVIPLNIQVCCTHNPCLYSNSRRQRFGIVALHFCKILVVILDSGMEWFCSGRSLNVVDAGWKMENGIIVGGQAEPGQRGGSLVSQAQFKDVELELDFMFAEQPAAPDGSCTTCTFNSGVYLRTGYQTELRSSRGRRVRWHRRSPCAPQGHQRKRPLARHGRREVPQSPQEGGLEPCPDLLQGPASPGHLERDKDLRRHRQPGRGRVERSGSDQFSMAARWRGRGLRRIRKIPQRANSGPLAWSRTRWRSPFMKY